MEVKVADHAGFCFGVKRAVDMCYKEADTKKHVYTLGPIIHNEMVVKDLEERGVKVISSVDEIDFSEVKDPSEVSVIIRSHGITKAEYKSLEDKKVNIVSATCPFVSKIHRIVEEEHEKGSDIIIIGSKKHPEVMGINGWCDNSATILESEEEARKYRAKEGKRVVVVSQTTFNYRKFQYIVDILQKICYNVIVMNTICNATEERQTEARLLAEKSDAMLVIGGKNSSNTQKLYEICKAECSNTYFIQTLDDLDLVNLKSVRSVGITAGASTPNNIIKEVRSYVRTDHRI